MPVKVLMPALSPTMKEGTLAKWLVKEGDLVKSGQIIAEIETDKATVEFETVDEGTLSKIIIPEGTTDVSVNETIAILLEDDETLEDLEKFLAESQGQNVGQSTADQTTSSCCPKASDTKSTPEQPSPSCCPGINETQPTVRTADDRIIATPLAKKIASLNNVDLSSIDLGSGPDGRIVKHDVESTLSMSKVTSQRPSNIGAGEEIKISQMRQVIAQRLLESKQTIPHFYLSADCILENLLQVRQQINNALEEKITINDFIVKAVAFAIAQNPNMNVSWQGNVIKRHASIDVSVAVAIDDGLITPIVRSADALSLPAISYAVKELVAKAKSNKLSPNEFQGGSFTISNLGMYGVKEFTAIVNPPQSGIIAIGAGIKKPVVVDDQIVIRTVMTITLSCDHRVIDGAVAASFLKVLQSAIENPAIML